MEDFEWDYSKSEEVLRKEYLEQWNKWREENPGQIVPPGTIYKTTEPEFVGIIPIRQDIEVIPANKEDKSIGWTCCEYSGAEITKSGSSEPLTKESDLQVGDEIIVPTLVGEYNGTVEKDSDGKLYAKIGDHTVADLCFAADDRKCWVTTYAINTRGLKNLK